MSRYSKSYLHRFKITFASVMALITLIYSSIGLCFHDATGRLVHPSEFENKWIIVNYWADWCDSCIEEIPELNSFYKNNKAENIVIFGVNYDKLANPTLVQVIQKMGIMFPVLQEDPAKKWHLGEITVLPTTFIVSPEGDVVRKIIGPNTEQSLLKVVHNRLYGKKLNKQKKNSLA